jgi:hypothetical protein
MELLRDMIDWAVGGIIDGYEQKWTRNNLTDDEFDERQELMTKLGFDVATREYILSDEDDN